MSDVRLELRHHLALKYSAALCILIIVGLGFRLVFADEYPIVIAWSAAHVVLALLLYGMVRSARYPRFEAPLLLALSFSTLVPLMLVTGGVNSQLTSLLVCFPFVAALLGNRGLPLIVFMAVVALILGMLAFNDIIIDMSGEAVTGWKVMARAAWLVIAVFLSTVIGSYFQHAYIELTRKLEEQATIDHLTGLLNRRGLETRLDEELKRQKRTDTPLALLMLDVDNFKLFNDTYGHAAGDQCLVALAECLGENTRGEDLLARFGGEEFLVVLINVTRKQAELAAEKLRQTCSEIRLPGVAESVSVTIGMVSVDASTSVDREALIKYADDALYRGKLNGRNQVMSSISVVSADKKSVSA